MIDKHWCEDLGVLCQVPSLEFNLYGLMMTLLYWSMNINLPKQILSMNDAKNINS